MIPSEHAKQIEHFISGVVLDVAELPDRTSPDDWPEAMMVTPDELRVILTDRLEEAIASALAEPQATLGPVDPSAADYQRITSRGQTAQSGRDSLAEALIAERRRANDAEARVRELEASALAHASTAHDDETKTKPIRASVPSDGAERQDLRADNEVIRTVPPFQHPGYIIRRGKPGPPVVEPDEDAEQLRNIWTHLKVYLTAEEREEWGISEDRRMDMNVLRALDELRDETYTAPTDGAAAIRALDAAALWEPDQMRVLADTMERKLLGICEAQYLRTIANRLESATSLNAEAPKPESATSVGAHNSSSAGITPLAPPDACPHGCADVFIRDETKRDHEDGRPIP